MIVPTKNIKFILYNNNVILQTAHKFKKIYYFTAEYRTFENTFNTVFNYLY